MEFCPTCGSVLKLETRSPPTFKCRKCGLQKQVDGKVILVWCGKGRRLRLQVVKQGRVMT